MATHVPKPSQDPKAEVRRCHRCGSATLICFNAWEHRFGGVDNGRITRDCRCQTCGTVVVLHDPGAIRVLWVVGVIMLVTTVPGLIALALAYRRRRAWVDNPIVGGAAYPPIRYRLGPGERRCGGCGGECRIASVTRHRHNGIPTGTDYQYECHGCGRSFKTESAGGIAFSVIGGLFFVGCGYVLLRLSKESVAWRYGGGGLSLLGGGFLIAQAAKRVLTALQNPTA